VRGFQVAPAEIEGVLLLHPDIVDCAVIGLQRSMGESELPRAFIVARLGSRITARDVREFTKDRLARYKQLDGGIVFVDKVPRNANGKLQKGDLRRMVHNEIAARL
jgi:4-coumarate--CoA ligase